jgi:hypothetical protein
VALALLTTAFHWNLFLLWHHSCHHSFPAHPLPNLSMHMCPKVCSLLFFLPTYSVWVILH